MVVLEVELVSALTGAGDRLLRGVRGIELLRRAPCPKSQSLRRACSGAGTGVPGGLVERKRRPEGFGWTGDAATAFLQGEQPSNKRTLPLYIRPPDDGVTRSTSLLDGNIYGLADAPRPWAITVVQRLKKLGYRQHFFDRMDFLLFNKQDERISIVLVYVDDLTSLAVLQVGVSKHC